MSDSKPVNFDQIAESFELALTAHDEIPDGVVDDITHTVEEAVANNDDQLMSKDDYDEFTSLLDGVLDSIYGNGYKEQINQLDAIREQLEPGEA